MYQFFRVRTGERVEEEVEEERGLQEPTSGIFCSKRLSGVSRVARAWRAVKTNQAWPAAVKRRF